MPDNVVIIIGYHYFDPKYVHDRLILPQEESLVVELSSFILFSDFLPLVHLVWLLTHVEISHANHLEENWDCT